MIRVGNDKRTKILLGSKKRLEPGIYAIVKVLSKVLPQKKNAAEYWVNPQEINLNKKIVKIKYLKASLQQPVRIQDLKKIKGIKDKYIIKGFQATSMPLEESSFNKIFEKFGESDESPTADLDELGKKTSKIKKLYKTGKRTRKPKGQKQPERVVREGSPTYKRDPAIKAFVLNEAKGICEACDKAAPFIGSDHEPFLEVHHLILLADGGPDTVDNAVALCPNCHRQLHYGMGKKKLRDVLTKKTQRIKLIKK